MGDTFEVVSDEEITLADGTILPAGYSGRGEVTIAEKNGMLGKSGELGIRINYLKCGNHAATAAFSRALNARTDPRHGGALRSQ